MSVFFSVVLLLTPALLVLLCQKFRHLDKIGLVALTFGAGIFLSAVFDVSSQPGFEAAQRQISEISIALAIPLLLFSIKINQAIGLAGDTLKSMSLALLSVLLVTASLSFLFASDLERIWQIAGLAVGVYTGGGPNMAAIKTAIDGDEDIFVIMTSYDILLSAIYLVFVMTLAKPLFALFLRPYTDSQPTSEHGGNDFEHMSDETAFAYKNIWGFRKVASNIKALLAATIAVAIGVAIGALVPSEMGSAVTIISITTFGLLFGFVPPIHRLKNSFQLGMYLILVFCFAMGAQIDLQTLLDLDLVLFSYIGLLLAGTLMVHATFCKLFKIDVDTFLITSSAAIMSVPFIPVIAGAIKNKALILPGFAVAIIGYVVGNYLGIAMAIGLRYVLVL